MTKFKIYVKTILFPLLLGGLIGLIISNYMDYDMLIKPLLSPPSFIFPIAWTIIYILMGLSYGILKEKSLITKKINIIYYLQLIVNALWSIFFFVFKWRLFSFIWILILIVLVIIMILEFYKQNKLAGLLQIPYLLWITFASYLNLSIYLLNN